VSKKIVVVICILFALLAFSDVAGFVTNARGGLLLFGNNVLPVLFPFFFISSLLVELDLFKCRRAQGIGIVAISFLSGYPTGARMLAELYTRGEITREKAIKTATYTSVASPIFIIATVGTAMYGDVRLGVIIFAAHVAGALVNGLLYTRGAAPGILSFVAGVCGTRAACARPRPCGHVLDASATASSTPGAAPRREMTTGLSDSISRALYSSVQNIMAVGGLIVIFFIASAPLATPIAAVLEMTTGVFRASETGLGGIWRAVIPCLIVSFGGFCVAMQAFVFLKEFKMPVWFYFLYKVTHAVIAAGVCAVLLLVMT